ncbi:LacI family DNA-binding transcriptional regulator [Kineococcus gynurae]|uniref:LacI family DNA-binding transcriptional regulator n=1 Tax=Kineococcus gynurae TaxID=452979 RepID=A0ABV5LPL1_9ACTN
MTSSAGTPAARRTTRPTLATIAASAGVSVATVSKVVNGRDDVAEQTRAHVQALLRQHDYASPTTRRVAAGTTVEFLINGVFAAYATEVVDGVITEGAESGTSVVVGKMQDASRLGRAPGVWARELKVAGRAGVVVVTGELTGDHVDALAEVGLPLVVIDPVNLPRSSVTSVGSTNFTGGFTATQHLLGLGHRRIGYVGGPPKSGCNQARLHGYRAAHEVAGVHPRPELIGNQNFDYECGLELGARILALPDPPTGIVAGSDSIALGVIEAARRRGLRVPDDLSVTGFDDTELAAAATPPLTVIRQPLHEMGRVALRTVLRMAAGETLDSHHVELATQLVVRGSTGPAPR